MVQTMPRTRKNPHTKQFNLALDPDIQALLDDLRSVIRPIPTAADVFRMCILSAHDLRFGEKERKHEKDAIRSKLYEDHF